MWVQTRSLTVALIKKQKHPDQMMLYLLNPYQSCFLMVKSCAQVRNLPCFLAKQTWHKFICGFVGLFFFGQLCSQECGSHIGFFA